MALREMEQTVSTLWEAVYDFMQEHKLRINTGSNLAGFVTEDEDTYTLCHYESSFEVVDMKFLRSPGYLTFFDYLDKKGGIFYENDLPIVQWLHAFVPAANRSRDIGHVRIDSGCLLRKIGAVPFTVIPAISLGIKGC
ncbi:glycolipid 2-alpha-mannosyltransferase-domain-containing protein [Lactarius deliciosus]|nr:glycolipid 2-alpha-mannosyltransferase-domain-containing protein [Lactarius deliciosus]